MTGADDRAAVTASGPAQPTYRHTQVGVLPIIMWIVMTAFCAALALREHLMILWVTSAILAVFGLGMSYLTTTVTAEQVRVVFGPQLYRKRIPIADIASVEPARSFPLEGWGIRITGEGMLYNITGDEAVRVHLRSGGKLRIGTDDVAGLIAAITTAVNARGERVATA